MMRIDAKRVALLAAFSTLAACGGSSTGGIQYGTTNVSGFNELADVSQLYPDQFGGDVNPDRRETTPAEMPTSGTATYTGVMYVASPQFSPLLLRFEHAAKTTIAVAFETGEVTGETGQFYDVTDRETPTSSLTYGDPVSGSVSYTLAGTPGGGNDFIGSATGTIENGSGTIQAVNEVIGARVMGPDASGFRVLSLGSGGLDIDVSAVADP